MALDYMGIISNGTYPTPTPTDTKRSIEAVSQGLLVLGGTPPIFTGNESGGLNDVGTSTTL